MVRLSALAAKTRFGETLDKAHQGPVTIEKHGRRVAVLIAASEYDRLIALEEFKKDVHHAYRQGHLVLLRDRAKAGEQPE